MTQWVMEAWDKGAKVQFDGWLEKSWAQGEADPVFLSECRVRADTYSAMRETQYDDYCGIHGVDPVTE